MYQLTDDGVKHLPTNRCIPDSPRNRDWQAYVEWVKNGNSPLPKEIIPDVTEEEEFQRSVSVWIKAIILEAGLDPARIRARVRNMRGG